MPAKSYIFYAIFRYQTEKGQKKKKVKTFIYPIDCFLLKSTYFVEGLQTIREKNVMKNKLRPETLLVLHAGHIRHVTQKKRQSLIRDRRVRPSAVVEGRGAEHVTAKSCPSLPPPPPDDGRFAVVSEQTRVHDTSSGPVVATNSKARDTHVPSGRTAASSTGMRLSRPRPFSPALWSTRPP